VSRPPPQPLPQALQRSLLQLDRHPTRTAFVGYVVSPTYLEAVGTPVLRGRGLEASDGPDAERVALVNEAFVRTQLDGRNAIGEVALRAVETPSERACRKVSLCRSSAASSPDSSSSPWTWAP